MSLRLQMVVCWWSCLGIQCRDTNYGAVQLPLTDNVNTTQLCWRDGLRGLVNCHVSYRPSEHDTCPPTHIPHSHTLPHFEIPGIYCQTRGFVSSLNSDEVFLHDSCTLHNDSHCNCFLRNKRPDHMT